MRSYLIDEASLNQLVHHSFILQELNRCGVEEWHNYDKAMEKYFNKIKELEAKHKRIHKFPEYMDDRDYTL